MSKISLQLTGEWKKFQETVNEKGFKERLDANLAKGTAFNGKLLQAEIRKRIRSKAYIKNAPLTVLIKKSSTALIDDGDLWGSVNVRNIDAYTVFVGVLKTTMAKGVSMANIAEMLHQGAVLEVTEHMRNMFALLAEVAEGKRTIDTLEGRVLELAKALGTRIKQIKALKPTTTHIVIPARPFIKDVLEDPIIRKKCEENWRKAVRNAFQHFNQHLHLK